MEVKIGYTCGPVQRRVTELFTTGRSRPLVQLWSVFVDNPQELELRMHDRFAAARISNSREFFSISPQDAIVALIDEAAPFRLPDPCVSEGRVDIFLRLLTRHGSEIFNRHIKGVSIVVTTSGVRLEINRFQEEVGGSNQLVDLSFLSDPRFTNDLSAEQNADLFVELDPVALSMIDGLLDNEKAQAVFDRYRAIKANSDPALDTDP
ncbi:GIY-YIG nuclease family protein [Arthrobacter sp. R3-55]